MASKADSLLNILEQEKLINTTDQLYDLYQQLGKAYGASGEEKYDLAISYYEEAYQVAKSQGDNEKLYNSLFGLGESNQRRNAYQDALKNYYKIIELDLEKEKEVRKAKSYTQISSIYQALGNYDKAYENQMAALLIFEVNKDEFGIANSNYNLGSIFFYQNQYKEALKHYEAAKIICDKLNKEIVIYSCLAALGSVHEKLGNYEKSLEYNQSSLQLAKKLNYKTGIAYSRGNIAISFLNQKDFLHAEQNLIEAITLKIELGDKYGSIGSSIDLSRVYLEWGKPSQAIPVLEKALRFSEEVESKTRQTDVYKNLALVYDQLNKPLKAYEYTKKYVEFKDLLLNEKTLEEMGQSKRRYEVEKQEHEIEILKKENELLGKNEKIQQLQFFLFAVLSLAFLVFAWWYRNKLKYQNKVNQLLEEKNQLLNLKNEEIDIKNKQLEHSNEDLKQFAYVASHDLKEPLRMIHSYTNLLQRRYDSLFDESGKEFMFYITDAVTRMQTLLDDLLDFSRAGTQPAPDDFISTEDVMVIVEANLRHRLETLNAKLVVRNENLPKVKAHRTMMIQLLQNLVSNGVKFKGARDPEVIVNCIQEENRFVFSVADNGIGISEENLEKVFEMFRRLHTRDEYEGTGIGLATCKRIVTTWGGDLWVESVEGEGSTFFFSVPASAAVLEEKEMAEMVLG